MNRIFTVLYEEANPFRIQRRYAKNRNTKRFEKEEDRDQKTDRNQET